MKLHKRALKDLGKFWICALALFGYMALSVFLIIQYPFLGLAVALAPMAIAHSVTYYWGRKAEYELVDKKNKNT